MNKKSFFVMTTHFGNGEVEKYDVMPYFESCIKRDMDRGDKLPTTFDGWREWVDRWSHYQFWSRCEYEILISDWPNETNTTKIDVHYQIMNNVNIVTQLVIELADSLKKIEKSSK